MRETARVRSHAAGPFQHLCRRERLQLEMGGRSGGSCGSGARRQVGRQGEVESVLKEQAGGKAGGTTSSYGA